MTPSLNLNAKNVSLAQSTMRVRRSRRRWWKWVLIIIGILACLAVLMAAYYYPKAKRAYSAGQAATAIAKKIPGDLSQQNFTKAKEHVTQLEEQLSKTSLALDQMQGLRWWPYVGRQYAAVDSLMSVGEDSAKAVGTLVDFLSHVFAPFADKGKVSLASISPAEKGTLLGGISQRGPELRQAQEDIHRAADTLEGVPTTGLLPPLHNIIAPLKEQFPLVTQALDQAIPATKVFPTVLGYPEAKTYLFLLENNTELRPGGGFIGTYGLLKLRSADIESLTTDNVYNLDNAAESLPTIEPPDPMKKYLKSTKWFFRDANWSPDFPTSAQQALTMYQREGGSKEVDGVMAVTPTAISNLLGLVGAIKVDGIEFTKENFTETLEFQVEKGFVNKGVTETQRKDIIGDLTKILVDRLLNLPLSEWKDLFLTMSDQLAAKQILLYMKDSASQSILVDQNWAGAIASQGGSDYLMVVDANLASLKTDAVMERTYTYEVTQGDQTPEAKLTIHYKNTGKFDWKTTRYNTYVRVYVPEGSVLIESSGSQKQEKSNAVGQVTTTTELGKTVFGTYKSIEPGKESDLVVRYTLPAGLGEAWSREAYRLSWQKQPGMLTPSIHLLVKSQRHPVQVEGLDNQQKLDQNSVRYSGVLPQDRTVSIQY